jgi:uncharacterized protein
MEVAESGDPEVWHALGDAFNYGRGTQPDKEAGILWFRRAADAGHAKSMVSLGLCLQRQETPEGGQEAIRWFRQAANLGDSGGMLWLGFAFRSGTNVTEDFETAIEWFIKAVEAGDGHSMIHVGRMYADYLHSPSKAVPWYLSAAEAGFTESHVALAMLYDDRKSDIYNPVEAVKWWLVVAEGKSSSAGRAMVALARHYRDGIGTTPNPQTAKHWLQKALLLCNPKSEFYREAAKLLKEMDGDLL